MHQIRDLLPALCSRGGGSVNLHYAAGLNVTYQTQPLEAPAIMSK
jgi:hypothetical protein